MSELTRANMLLLYRDMLVDVLRQRLETMKETGMETTADGFYVVNGHGTYAEVARQLYREGEASFAWTANDGLGAHNVMFAVRRAVWHQGQWNRAKHQLHAGANGVDVFSAGGTLDADDICEYMAFEDTDEDEAFAVLFNGIWRAWVELLAGRNPVLPRATADDPFKLTLPE